MSDTNYETRAAALRERHDALAASLPRAPRAREMARLLGVSEAEWVAAQCGGLRASALAASGRELIAALPAVGEVMALTRNPWCVHERHGAYQPLQGEGGAGLVLGEDIDLRLFFGAWRHAWAVEHQGRRSLQFFDGAGTAVHKVYATAATDAAAWDALVAGGAHAPFMPQVQADEPAALPARPVADAAGLRAAWLAMQDTHEFFPLLRRFDAHRLRALEAGGADLAQPVAADAAERMLEAAAATELPIMCFVGNRGIIQIHTGPVRNIRRLDAWLNVLDERFNLHLDTAGVAASWVVNKPTRDGWVTSLELYAASGELIVQFFGKRKPGQPEQPAWRRLLESLCAAPLAAGTP